MWGEWTRENSKIIGIAVTRGVAFQCVRARWPLWMDPLPGTPLSLLPGLF